MRILKRYQFVILTLTILALSIYISIYSSRIDIEFFTASVTRLRIHSPETPTKTNVSQRPFIINRFPELYMSISDDSDGQSFSLQYDYYRESCPSAERIIRRAVKEFYSAAPTVAPSLIRLLFHDCFVEGCDASVLLDSDGVFDSEKDSPPNQSLKGFDVIDTIKEELESACPSIVSCADILALAAREAVLVAGGPFYPLYTGRKDSLVAFADSAADDIPSPHANLSDTLDTFATKGFDERETVSLLGAHSIGISHCQFFKNRLYNFSGTSQPDPSLDPVLLQELKNKCCQTGNSSTCNDDSTPLSDDDDIMNSTKRLTNMEDPFVSMTLGEEAAIESFGTRYYRGLLRNRGVLFADQQLMTNEETATWVKAYAYSPFMFRRDFSLSMMKLSNLNVLTGSLGQVRSNCSKVSPF